MKFQKINQQRNILNTQRNNTSENGLIVNDDPFI
jgi:hypothetical protein